MNNNIAVAQKCIREVLADKRTVMMILVMPLIVLTLVYILFNGSTPKVQAGYVGSQNNINQNQNQVQFHQYANEKTALSDLKNGKIEGLILFDTQKQAVDLPQQFQIISGEKSMKIDVPSYEVVTKGDDPINDPVVSQAIIDSIEVDESALITKNLNEKYDIEDYLIIF